MSPVILGNLIKATIILAIVAYLGYEFHLLWVECARKRSLGEPLVDDSDLL